MRRRSITRDFPGFSSVYYVRRTGGKRPYVGDIDLPVDDQFALLRGELLPRKPVEVRWEMGERVPKDVIWTTVAAPVIVSQRVIDLLEHHGFTGWSSYPARVPSRDGERSPGFWGLSIRGRCGPIDKSQSVAAPKQYPGGVFPVLKGMLFDPKTWDGSDIFTVQRRGAHIFVVAAVRKALAAAKVRNLRFEPLDAVEQIPI